MKKIALHRIAPFLGLALLGAALWALHHTLSEVHLQDVLRHLGAIPAGQILLAGALTATSYLAMTAYDRLGLIYIRHPLSWLKATQASFISYAFSNTIGLSLLTSGSVRYRIYSAWGLGAEEITRLVLFVVVTFWLGLIAVGGIVFVAEPIAFPALAHLPQASLLPLGVLFLAILAAYLLMVIFRRRPFVFRNWEFSLPRPGVAFGQLLAGAVDWMLAAAVLYVLLPTSSQISFFQLLGIFLLAQVVALISHVPGGLGVFESMVLLSAPAIPPDALFGSLLIFRVIYYLFPFAVAVVLLGVNEGLQKKVEIVQAALMLSRWSSVVVPPMMAAATLVGGAILLFSGATPAVPERLRLLRGVLPLPVIEISHFLGSIVGAGLLLLSRGLQRRLDGAYILSMALLTAGIILSMLKGGDFEEAILLAAIVAVLLPCRRHFYRRSSLFSQPFTAGWIAAVVLVLACSLWLWIFSFKHLAYSHDLWWHFTFTGDAPRSLRATVGAVAFLLFFAAAKLLRPAPPKPTLPSAAELEEAHEVISRVPQTSANLALLGDKALLFNERKSAFIMYGIEGRSWVALGDPVGAKEAKAELTLRFRELSERNGGWPVFYEVGHDALHLYLDLGLALIKLGEEARVDLPEFSLEGGGRSGLRHTHRSLEKEGCTFEIAPAREVEALLPRLKTISDGWLARKNTREKGFSLGFFDPGYLCRNPVALIRREGQIIAFANLWQGAGREELSIDLMRFLAEAPRGTMEFLFIKLMMWGSQEGYHWFNLGMAPLAGLENRPFAPLWNRVGALIFRHGEHFYNFQGLRAYKEKFQPVWEPRYLASPGGIALPTVLANVAALVSGGIKGVLGK